MAITYTDKVQVAVNPLAPEEQWRALDANEVKTEVNANITATGVAQGDIDAHEALTNNPHSVTASQVGLGSVDDTSDANKPVSTAQQTALDAVSLNIANPQIDNYTLVLTDKDKRVEMNKATAVNLTIPLNSTVAFPIGTVVYPIRAGIGALTIVATGGVTITNTAGVLTDPGQNILMTLIKTGTDTWLLQNGGNGVWQTWVPTFTGFSVQPTGVDASYCQLGAKVAVLRWEMATAGGTSNSVNFTMTIPFLARSQTRYPCLVLNAGTFSHGEGYSAAGSNIVSFFRGALSFTASGAKGSYGQMIIEIQ